MLSSWRVGTYCIIAVLVLDAAPARAGAAPALPSRSGPLTLDRALELARRHHLDLSAAELRAGAAQARVRDAGRAPNPTLAASGENFGGGLGSDRLETTLEVAQTIELGGDRAARKSLASGEHRAAIAETLTLRQEVLVQTAERFIRAWSLQERLARLRAGEAITRQAILAASARHRAGASPLLEQARAESEALAQAVERRRAEAELAAARRELSLCWGEAEASFDSLAADAPAGTEGLAAEVAAHPELTRAGSDEDLAMARVRAAQAARTPDVTLSGGVRRLEEAGGTGFIAGIEMPLPIWNRGGGAVDAARREHDAARANRRAVTRRLEVELANAIDRVQSSAAAYDTLRLRVRPSRQNLIEEALRAYRAGRLGYLDLIAEQRNLLETDLAIVDARADLWRSRVRLELLFHAGQGGVR